MNSSPTTRMVLQISSMLVLTACAGEPAATSTPAKLSQAGESCQKTADCAGNLACIGSVCGVVVDGAADSATGSTDAAGGPDTADTADVVQDVCTPTCGAGSCSDGCGGYCAGPCSDNNACTTGDKCILSDCVGEPISCDDGNPCTIDACTTSDGKCGESKVADGTPCSDGTQCTTGDACIGGLCTGTPVSCNDNNPCTEDTCDAKGECQSSQNTAPCDDGNKCTAGDVCAKGACSGTPVSCDDNNICTDDSCDKASGTCAHANNTGPCNDTDPCTAGDSCYAGVCAGTPTFDPCFLYGGEYQVLKQGKVSTCNMHVGPGGWNSSKICAGWSVCSVAQIVQSAPATTFKSDGGPGDTGAPNPLWTGTSCVSDAGDKTFYAYDSWKFGKLNEDASYTCHNLESQPFGYDGVKKARFAVCK